MASDCPAVVLIVLCILQFGCNNVASSSDNLDCFDERFNSVKRCINESIDGQRELDDFVNNLADDDEDKCVQLFLTGESYTLDMIKIMGIKLGGDGGLVIVGVSNPRVTINVTNVSKEELINSTLIAMFRWLC